MVENRTKSDGFMLRFPDGLRDVIKEKAERSGRSMNAEIVARLEQSLTAPLGIPESLFERITNYAARYERTANEEILRILAREFPEPEGMDVVVSELLDLLAVLKDGVTSNKVERLVFQLEDTIKGIISGRIQGSGPQEQSRIRQLWEVYQERRLEEAAAREAQDEGEESAYGLTGGTQKYGQSDPDDDDIPQGDR